MFERYTEKARRIIFFARYEASQFGSPYIETEHLLLGLLREDKPLANRFLRSHAAVESIRKQIEAHTPLREKLSTTVDLPLSHECKRVLAYGAEEAERLNHKHIGTAHFLVGLLREKESFASQLLHEQGVTLESAREHALQSELPAVDGASPSIARLERWLAEREARGVSWTFKQRRLANQTVHFAIYPVDQGKESEKGEDIAAAEKLIEQIQKRIESIVEGMERAIATHEFAKARSFSDEERKERDKLRLLREQLNLEELTARVPLLCIEILRDDRFSEVQKRCDDYIAEGVSQVWLLAPNLKRAYTVNQAEGLREFRAAVLKATNPPLEIDLNSIFE